MKKFRQKDFSLIADIAKGATIGGGLGILGSNMFLPPKDKKVHGPSERGITAFGAGTLIGAALGLLYGVTKEITTKINRSTTVNQRLMETVVENLKKTGFKEGKDFTRDPKLANEVKTKVCIVVSKTDGDLKLLVNTVSDSKLKSVTENMVKNIPNSSTVTKKMSDRFNDVVITSISDSSADYGLVTGIAEFYIRHKYPVYLVEVG